MKTMSSENDSRFHLELKSAEGFSAAASAASWVGKPARTGVDEEHLIINNLQ